MKHTHRSETPNPDVNPPREPTPVPPSPEPTLGTATGPAAECGPNDCSMELTEEYLVAQKQPVQEGEVRIHKEVETVLQRMAVEAAHDEIYVEHVPINQSVSRRLEPWHEDDTLVVPVYEEKVMVTRRLVLKEKLRIRRVTATEQQHFAEQVQREHPVIQELGRPGVVQERYASERPPAPVAPAPRAEPPRRHEPASGGIFHRLADLWNRAA